MEKRAFRGVRNGLELTAAQPAAAVYSIQGSTATGKRKGVNRRVVGTELVKVYDCYLLLTKTPNLCDLPPAHQTAFVDVSQGYQAVFGATSKLGVVLSPRALGKEQEHLGAWLNDSNYAKRENSSHSNTRCVREQHQRPPLECVSSEWNQRGQEAP
ncbi:hypothetical protein SELMODRAFT_421242 [Selaginella moellendorffii]|uniref:Uncharacterized protein n=1 Tax=Selaginella moellendorffii TaxID=88036 RepID=D8SEG2_SELML|nr:hypothetical protein SELMODRAFT_421242 [Selaginella moellendorffii]